MDLDVQILLKNALDCISKDRLKEAEDLLKKALGISINDPDILRLASVVAALGRDYVTALEFIDQAIFYAPLNGVAHSNRGNILKELHRYEEALCSYEKAIELMPDYAEAYNNKGNVLQDTHRYEEALIWYDQAIAINPNYFEAYCNKGNALEWLRRHDEAMVNFDKATAINPQHIDAYWQKAMNQLVSGNYELGLQNYEARWSKSNPVVFRHMDIPRLESLKDIGDKEVLVWAEQGLGDVIQFCRYIKPLALAGAKVTFDIPPQLEKVLEPLRKFCRLQSSLNPSEKSFDFQSPLMSLPLVFGTTVDTIPNEIPYLISDNDKKKKLQGIIQSSPNLKVGIVWSGGYRLIHSNGYADFQRRNIDLEQIAALKEVEGVDFYSLQKGDPAESELLMRKDEVWPELINLGSYLNDFSDTAALIDDLDLIISVDTSTAHLAGALGKPVWMLNRFDSCWRWLRGRKDSPWYPDMVIHQQDKPGDGGHVIEIVNEDLSSLSRLHAKK